MKATLVYHLASGRIVREPAEVPEGATRADYRDHVLRDLASAMINKTKGGQAELVPLLTITDDYGRDHLVITANVEDVEVVLED